MENQEQVDQTKKHATESANDLEKVTGLFYVFCS